MARPLVVNGPATPEEVEAAYRRATDRRDRERLLAVHLAQQGELSLRGIARAVMRGRAAISRWLRAFREGGIPGLLSVREHKGRHPSPSVKALIELDDGLVKGRWQSVPEIQRWLAGEHGTAIKDTELILIQLNKKYYGRLKMLTLNQASCLIILLVILMLSVIMTWIQANQRKE